MTSGRSVSSDRQRNRSTEPRQAPTSTAGGRVWMRQLARIPAAATARRRGAPMKPLAPRINAWRRGRSASAAVSETGSMAPILSAAASILRAVLAERLRVGGRIALLALAVMLPFEMRDALARVGPLELSSVELLL